MQYITMNDLQAVGITVKDNEVDALLEHLNNQLEERVGVEITEELNDEQLEKFVEVQDSDDGKVLGEWLNENVPELKEIVKDEIDILLGELAENADGLNKIA